jgi:quaternary ammonium compound-resistance protein SugE
MELFFICLIGAVIGLIARYVLPERQRHGTLLVPAIGTAAGAVVWVGLTWAGTPWNGGWIWTITLALTAIISCAAALLIGQGRKRSDEKLLAALSKAAVRTA